jgi:hypothetical protein
MRFRVEPVLVVLCGRVLGWSWESFGRLLLAKVCCCYCCCCCCCCCCRFRHAPGALDSGGNFGPAWEALELLWEMLVGNPKGCSRFLVSSWRLSGGSGRFWEAGESSGNALWRLLGSCWEGLGKLWEALEKLWKASGMFLIRAVLSRVRRALVLYRLAGTQAHNPL